jgi:DNA helicase-2/ATP-dependent DNA helicase PcrA
VDRLLAEMGFLDQFSGKGSEEEARAENIAEFRRTAHEYDASNPSGGLPGFLQGISLLTGADDYDGDTDRMVFMTLHCAKGLEFRVVFVAGVEEGLLPFVRPGEFAPADLEEERRLMYVGMTRARDLLYLTHVHDRDRPGVRMGGPSRFISEAASAFAPAETPIHAPAAAGGTTVFRRGNLVHHPRYGRGIVLHAARRGSEWQLTVDFGFDEPKVLLTGYVPITVLKEKGTKEEAF